MALVVIIAVTAGAGAVLAAVVGKRGETREPIPVRVRKRHG